MRRRSFRRFGKGALGLWCIICQLRGEGLPEGETEEGGCFGYVWLHTGSCSCACARARLCVVVVVVGGGSSLKGVLGF